MFDILIRTSKLYTIARRLRHVSVLKKRHFDLNDDEVLSLVITTIMAGITLVLLGIFYYWLQDPIGVTLSAGAFGGFLHEFVQSKGRILFIERKDDGLYLGSISGLILGLVAGILIYGGTIYNIIPSTSPDQVASNSIHGIAEYSSIQQAPSLQDNLQMGQLLFEGLIAGVALKGISEAVTSPAKIKDSFDVISVVFQPKVGTANFANVDVTIKNHMDKELQLHAMTMSEKLKKETKSITSIATKDKITGEPMEEWLVPEKSATTIPSKEFEWVNDKTYIIEVVSSNGKVVVEATAPKSQSELR